MDSHYPARLARLAAARGESVIATIHLTNPRPCPVCHQPTHYAMCRLSDSPRNGGTRQLGMLLAALYWACPQCYATHNTTMVNEEDLP